MRTFVRLMIGLSLVSLAACASTSHTVVNAPSATAAGSTATGGTSTTAAKLAHVGDTISLKSTDQSPPAQITLVKVVDPAQGADQYTTPESGKRFVGVQLKIVLGGSSSTEASPDNDTTVYDAQGQSYDSSFSSLAGCQGFATPLTISPNEPVLGCVTFQVPTGVTVAKVKFTPASGFASVTAEWQVP